MRAASTSSALVLLLAHAATAQNVLDVGPGAPYPNIAAAVAAAQSGDTLRIQPGIYGEWFEIVDMTLRLVAAAPGVAIHFPAAVPRVALRPTDRVQFVGIRFQAAATSNGFAASGGSLTFENCTIATRFSAAASSLHLRRCSSTQQILLFDCHATISSSTLQAGAVPSGSPAAMFVDRGTLQMSTTIVDGGGSAPALLVLGSNDTISLVDSTLIGGTGQSAIEVIGGRVDVRTHRSTLTAGSPQLPAISSGGTVPGPLLALDTPNAPVVLGSQIVVDLVGEPGDGMLVIAGFRAGQAFAIPGLEQMGFAFDRASVVAVLIGDGNGRGHYALPIPNSQALRFVSVYFRGIDIAQSPVQMSAVAPFVIR